jgi:hypothetical protein
VEEKLPRYVEAISKAELWLICWRAEDLGFVMRNQSSQFSWMTSLCYREDDVRVLFPLFVGIN